VKVLQVINTLDTGGAEKLLLETIPLFNNRGIQMDILVFEKLEGVYLKQLQKLSCCKIYCLNSNSLYNPINIFKIIPYLRSYDILHVHLFPAQYWAAIAKIISLSRVKLLFTEHSTFNKRRSFFFFKYIDKFIYSIYNKIVCISNGVKNELEITFELSSNQLITIENGIDLKKFQNADLLKKTEIHNQILEGDKILVQVSKFRAEKDQITVIKCMLYVPENIKLLLVGDGPLKGVCQKLVKDLNLTNRVFFLGNRNDVENIYKTSDVSIVSSHWEGFGLVAVESMAAGKPVIASNVSGLSEIVDGAGLLFEKGNEHELATIVNSLLSNNNQYLYEKISHNCMIRAQNFGINNMVTKSIELYQNLINHKLKF
jgi:glycosyltransferase involved in cell wall biosynthesis